MENETIKHKVPKSPRASQQSRQRRRGSPEAHEEVFKRPGRPQPNQKSIFYQLTFIPGGGNAVYEKKKYSLGYTCNIDGTLMVLQALWRYTVSGRDFICSKVNEFPVTAIVIRAIEMIIDGDIGEAKMLWWNRVLQKPLNESGGFVNMLGNCNVSFTITSHLYSRLISLIGFR